MVKFFHGIFHGVPPAGSSARKSIMALSFAGIGRTGGQAALIGMSPLWILTSINGSGPMHLCHSSFRRVFITITKGPITGLTVVLAACVLAGPAAASEHRKPAEIDIACNEHGAIVTVGDDTTYYLGKQCDAARKDGGGGRWWFVASGFAIEINGRAIRFSNDLGCDVPYCSP